MDEPGHPITIGVSLAIPEPHAATLSMWRKRIGDPEADNVPPHVTLLPPTRIDEGELPTLQAHLATAAASVEPFTMRLSGTGTFRPVSQVVFVQVSRGISECELLEQAVRSEPVDRELQFPYHPHVTVGHDVSDDQLDRVTDGLQDFHAEFTVDRFVLYVQSEAGTWQPHEEFGLTGRDRSR